jgi:ABC-2 type transport system permease protein
VFIFSGFALVLDAFQSWAPQPVIDAVASLSFLTHFGSIAKGVIDIRDLLYFVTVVVVWLMATAIVLDLKKAD